MRDKIWTGFGIRDNSASRKTSSNFPGTGRQSKFGTVPKKSGQMVTLRFRHIVLATVDTAVLQSLIVSVADTRWRLVRLLATLSQ